MMPNCRWLLCLAVIGLAMHGVFPMNAQSRSKNDSSKTTNSDQKIKSHDESSLKERDLVLDSSPVANSTPDVANSISNVTLPLVPDPDASTSINPSKLGSHEQSHSKRHFRRSKLYRKEARGKSRASLIKSNVASGNLIPFGTDHLEVSAHHLLHNPENNSESIKLIGSTPKTSGISPSKTRGDAISLNYSIPTSSSRSVFTSRSEDTSDKISSVSSASTENSDNSSSSSEAGLVIDEKSSSVELMAFTFDSVEELRRSTFPDEVIKRVGNLTASPPIAEDHASSTIKGMVQTSDKSIVKSKSTSADIVYGGIDRGQSIQSARNDVDDDIIYSIHTESSRDTDRMPNVLSTSMRSDNTTNDDSVILVSIASESSVSKNSRNTSSKGAGGNANESNSAISENSNFTRPDVDEYSWVSINDSLNRISLNELVETLKNVDLRETRGSYSYSNSTPSQDTNGSLDSRIQIKQTDPISVKHSRSLTVPEVPQSPKELNLSMRGDQDINLSDHSNDLPVSTLTEKIEHPLKLTIPLNIKAISDFRTKNNIVVEDVKLSRPSTAKKPSDLKLAEEKDGPLRLVLDSSSSRCSAESSNKGLENIQKIDSGNPFYQRRSNEMTLSVSGSSISEPEQCLTRRSSAQMSPNLTHESHRPNEAFISPVISSNSEEMEVSESLPGNKSHDTETGTRTYSASTVDEDRGAQGLVSSGVIIFENLEPIVLESLASGEVPVPSETETTTARHSLGAFADLEEHCNASSFNVFIPSVNSRENIVTGKVEEESSLLSRANQNLTTTEDSLYIIEGFGFLKNSADEDSEIEEEFDRRRDVSFDYGETEIYPQLDDHPPPIKLLDQSGFETELPVKQEPLVLAGLQWKENDRNDDSWWFNDELNRRRGQAVKTDNAEERTVLIPSGFLAPKEVRAIPSLTDEILPDINQSDINNYRLFLLPTVYVLIGICVILVGCSIWCSKVSVKRQPNLPKLTYFIQERQGAGNAVV